MARVVRKDDNAWHKSARGNMTECGKSDARRPRPREIEGRRLVPCPQCYATGGQAKRNRDEAQDERHVQRMDELRPLVFARAGYRCERCGWRAGGGLRLEAHHRLMVGQGGPDTLENLVALCGPNPRGCHGWVHQHPTEAYACGLLIRQSSGPPAEPWEPPPGFGEDFWG